MGAILAIFYKEIKAIIENKNWKIIKLLIIGTLPAAIFGLLFKSFIETKFSSLRFIGFAFLITALFLFLTRFATRFSEKNQQNQIDMENISFLDALIIGIAQAIALFPGISRSGMTITAGLFRKLEPKPLMNFLFF